MSEPRSPRDRLRAIRAGRVSQLLDPNPADGLPPTLPPRLMLNGKPVATGSALDALLAQAHAEKVRSTLPEIGASISLSEDHLKTGDRTPKAPYINQLSPQQAIAMGNSVTAMLGLSAVTGATAVYFGVPGATYPDIYASRNQNEGIADVISRQLQAESTPPNRGQVESAPRPLASNDNSPSLSQFERLNVEIFVGESVDLNALFRRGNEVTQRKNDYIAAQFKARLDQCFDMHNVDADTEHAHGGSDPKRKERYFQDPRETSTRGSGSTDGSVRIRIGGNDYYIDFQTHDELLDGSPTLREATNLKKLLRLATIMNQVIRGEITPTELSERFRSRPSTGETLSIHTFGKGRSGTTWDQWKQRVDEELDDLFEDCQPIQRFRVEIPTDPIDPPTNP